MYRPCCRLSRNIGQVCPNNNYFYKWMPTKCVFKAFVSMIQREDKVQEHVHLLLRIILDKHPVFMSGIPVDGKISRESHCNMELMPGSTPKMPRSYLLTQLERTEWDAQVNNMLAMNCIRPCSPWASPVVFVHKSDGGFRMCVDARKLNAQTVPINIFHSAPAGFLGQFRWGKKILHIRSCFGVSWDFDCGVTSL